MTIIISNMLVLQAGLAPWPGVSAITLATAAAAVVVSWKQTSWVMMGLLITAGLTGIIAGVRNTDFLTVIVFPGPITGIIIGIGIFGLGMVKVIIS